ncbi:MAG: Hint domain-containing protein, partial [Mycobacterium sp.]
MADDIVDIDFSSVKLDGQAVTGTVQVDYTTGTATGTLKVDGLISVSHFTLTGSGPTYGLVGTGPLGGHLALDYTGQQPTTLDSAHYTTPVAPITIPLTVDPNQLSSTPVCFAAGTLIRTPAGDVAVETLMAGDLVLTASGAARPVKWVGHREYDFRARPDEKALPIRIVADAFGPNRPSQDLYLSAGHSVCLDVIGEVFVPVGHLVNYGTIARVETDTVSYWHVELDGHDVLVANNLPTESYLAMGNRGAFEEMRGLLPAILDGNDKTHADFCRPVVTHGPTVDFIRQRLETRADELGWVRSCDPDLRLLVDGNIRHPLEGDGTAVFLFPSGARDVRLVSKTFSPSAVGRSDRRTLGVMLTGLSFTGRGGEPRRVAIDDERLCHGVYPVEAQAGHRWRWTNGELVLDPQLWAGLDGAVSV